MKVGIYLVSDDNPSIGGNFSYYSKFIRSIESHSFSKELEVCFVGRMSSDKIKFKKEYIKLAPLFFYKIFKALNKVNIITLLSRIFSFKSDWCSRIDSSTLRKKKVDVLLFPKQFVKEVNDFPFISMNWDAGHKTTFAFPELLEYFEDREYWYRVEIQKAIAIFVESQSSKNEFCYYYQIPESKIEIIPLFAGGVIDLEVTQIKQEAILKGLNIDRNNYFYYPAQFWAHKNHYTLVQAFAKLARENKKLKLIFSGSDMGNKKYIVELIKESGLKENIVVLGFVSNEEVYTLYKNAIALVMPTFLGPTNMPILEAQALGTAVICSDLSGHRETCGDGALYADPSNIDNWHKAMKDILDPYIRGRIISNAERVKSKSMFNIHSAINTLESSLIKIIPIVRTFH
jgi:glycosyltransferase involved in cell wall biosynthesis